MNYYNEFDLKAAAWLRQLVSNGDVPGGIVDIRSITEVTPGDLNGFTQCHFFAGIGGWSRALRLAGWPEDRPVWTGSAPCQPFSTAGKNKGKSDERHLWPYFYNLVKECKPDTVFGEQVEGAIKHGWLDDLQTDLEREEYAVGHCVLGAHSLNAAHIRQRLYWMGHTKRNGHITDTIRQRTSTSEVKSGVCEPKRSSAIDRMGDTEHDGHPASEISRGDGPTVLSGSERQDSASEPTGAGTPTPLPVEWLYCRDNKYRPIEPGIKPLVDGIPEGVVCGRHSIITPDATQEARAVRLKGYGNAIVPQVAAEFIKAFMSC